MKRLLAIALFILLGASLAFADPVDDAYVKMRNAYKVFLTDVKAHRNADKWNAHIRAFLAFAEKHLEHARAADALFLAGDAYEREARWGAAEANRREAVAVYDRLARTYPSSPMAGDAMLRAAQIYAEKIKDPAEACRRCTALLAEKPDGEIAAKARQTMAKLGSCPAPPPAAPAAPVGPVGPVGLVKQAETSPPAAPQSVTVQRVEFWPADNRALIVVYVDAPPAVRQEMRLPAPNATESGSITVVLLGAKLASEAKIPDRLAPPVKKIDLRQVGVDVEVAVTTGPCAGVGVNVLPDPWRVTIEMTGAPAAAAARDARPRPLVVLDPGHGGADLGAKNGALTEKDTALILARLVRDRLQARGVAATLTRDSDVYLPLDARCALANDARATLFVSIHLNASPQAGSSGIETFVYEGRDGDDETVRRENQAGAAAPRPPVDPAARAALDEESRRFAKTIQRRLVESARQANAGELDRGVKAAPLYLLSGARMPAVLVEVGFATNRVEAGLLAKPAYCQRLADGIVRGVMEELGENLGAEGAVRPLAASKLRIADCGLWIEPQSRRENRDYHCFSLCELCASVVQAQISLLRSKQFSVPSVFKFSA
jgi:N-acetylmuramoyl-L-alanine amidase